MANLASTYRNQGRWTEAEQIEVQVLETRKRVLGEEHPNTLSSMANQKTPKLPSSSQPTKLASKATTSTHQQRIPATITGFPSIWYLILSALPENAVVSRDFKYLP